MIKVRNFSRHIYFSGNGRRLVYSLLLFTFHFSLFTAGASAQNEMPADAEAPPLKMMSKEDRNQLQAQNELKKRTVTALTLMDTRLKKAEELFAAGSYAEMFVELGSFHALMDDTLNFLNRNDNGSKQVMSNYKKVELSLRTFLSRLELIRREVPTKYEFYIRGLVKTVRDGRTRAVEPLFTDSILPNSKTDN